MTTTRKWTIAATASALLLLGVVSCKKSSGSSASTGDTASRAKVTRVVFIDKKNACDCTRKRADDSWANLAEAVGEGASIPVERIYIDTEKDRAAPFLELQNVMVIPGIYFLDEKGNLVAMLQGEQSASKLSSTLGK